MFRNERVASRVVEKREAPGIAEGNELCFARVEVREQSIRARSQLSDSWEVVDLAPQLRIQQSQPDKVRSSVSSNLEVCQQTLDNV